MKNRDYKNFAPGNYYHVYNRGDGKEDLFLDSSDYFNFLKRLRLALGKDTRMTLEYQGSSLLRIKPFRPDAYSLICYCLMPNHLHLLVRQDGTVGVGRLISKVCTSYAAYFNRKRRRVGHVFQDQFKAVLVDQDSYLLWLSAYIHTNPLVAGLVTSLEDYPWSSYLDYVGQRQGVLCERNMILGQFSNTSEYGEFVKQSVEQVKSNKNLEPLLLD